jgi:hypothetical protein
MNLTPKFGVRHFQPKFSNLGLAGGNLFFTILLLRQKIPGFLIVFDMFVNITINNSGVSHFSYQNIKNISNNGKQQQLPIPN